MQIVMRKAIFLEVPVHVLYPLLTASIHPLGLHEQHLYLPWIHRTENSQLCTLYIY